MSVHASLWLTLSAAASLQAELPRSARLELEPHASPNRPDVHSQSVPVQAGALVWVSSALRLFALDARTLEPRWSAGPPQGWGQVADARRAELFEGLDHELAWTMPGVGEQVVVAALLLPFVREDRIVELGRLVAKARPERRLFAYERTGGEPLWDHAPPTLPPSGGRGGGEFAQRTNVSVRRSSPVRSCWCRARRTSRASITGSRPTSSPAAASRGRPSCGAGRSSARRWATR